MNIESKDATVFRELVALLYVMVCVGFAILQMSCGVSPDKHDRGIPVSDAQGPGIIETDQSQQGSIDFSDSDLSTIGNLDAEYGSRVPSIVSVADKAVRESLGDVLDLESATQADELERPIPHDREVKIYLSFDDGPHSAELGTGRNHTENILRTLETNSVQDNIKALFNIQTHVDIRGANSIGQEVIRMIGDQGHIVSIHTGSTEDHVNHKVRVVYGPYDANKDGVVDVKDGVNGLESDIIRAIDRIEDITGAVPKYIRPTYGAFNSETKAVYSRHGLKMVLWDIDSGDSLRNYVAGRELASSLRDKVRRKVMAGEVEILVLFHDIKSGTQLYFDDYLIAIYEGAEDAGKFAVFPTTTEEFDDFLGRY